MGGMKPWKFQGGYSEIGCEVRQFYLNVSILFVLLLSIQVNVIRLVQKMNPVVFRNVTNA